MTRAALTLVDAEGGALRLETSMALVRRRRRLVAAPGPSPAPPPGRFARAAYALALAHAFDDRLVRGLAGDLADLARQTGLSRARITQLCDLLLLAPDLQEEVLFRVEGPGERPLTERGLRSVVRALDWAEQRRRYRALVARPWRYRPAGRVMQVPRMAGLRSPAGIKGCSAKARLPQAPPNVTPMATFTGLLDIHSTRLTSDGPTVEEQRDLAWKSPMNLFRLLANSYRAKSLKARQQALPPR